MPHQPPARASFLSRLINGKVARSDAIFCSVYCLLALCISLTLDPAGRLSTVDSDFLIYQSEYAYASSESLGEFTSKARLGLTNLRGVEMRQKSGIKRSHGEKVVKDIRRATRKQYSAKEKIRIVLDGVKGGAALRSCAAVRELQSASTKAGPRSFSKQERSAWQVIRRV